MYGMLNLGKETGVSVVPLYAVSDDPAATILDLSATMGVDILMMGTRHRRSLSDLLKGDVAVRVARDLPENIQLVIHG
jgi:nucleotide-binding universal stress UspA family protein